MVILYSRWHSASYRCLAAVQISESDCKNLRSRYPLPNTQNLPIARSSQRSTVVPTVLRWCDRALNIYKLIAMFIHHQVQSLQCPPRQVLELFAGIGGLAAAWPEATIATAIDIDRSAQRVYHQNFSHPYRVAEIESLKPGELRDYSAECWWMSPPCQPFTRRGLGRDLADHRCRALARLVVLLAECRPAEVALENVVGFEGSQAHRLLLDQLRDLGYHSLSRRLCPTEMGWPNRRPRFYLLASREPLPSWRALPQLACKLDELIDGTLAPDSLQAAQYALPEPLLQRYFNALDRVDVDSSTTACFASSYGKSTVRAGSYLRCGNGYRRFSPREVARLLGFSNSFRLDDLADRAAWKLLGNSLSLPSVRYVLSHLN